VKNNLYTGGASSGNTFSWDMKDNAGALVPTGKYKFRAVIAGDEGTQYEGKQQRIESPLFMIFNNPAQ
jgi:flagellar hook assembly protein FlgD